MHPFRQALDACRPGREDHAQAAHAAELGSLAEELARNPALAGELAAGEKADRLLQTALHEVAPPDGLNSRLLLALAAAVEPQGPISPAPEAVTRAPAAASPPARLSRRRWWQAAGGLAVAAAVGGIVFSLLPAPPLKPLSAEQLAHQVQEEWLPQIGPAAAWRSDLAAAPAGLAPDRAIRGRAGKWRAAASDLTVYDLTRSGGARAVLFVSSRPADVRSYPYTRLAISGRWKVGAWTRNGCVYVLAVVEDGQRIEDFLQRAPLT